MLLPRFSLRWIFLATTVFAFFSLVLAQAARGQTWAIALSLTALAAVGLMFAQAGVFSLARLLRVLTLRQPEGPALGQSPFAESPFAANLPVKQVVEPPVDPDI